MYSDTLSNVFHVASGVPGAAMYRRGAHLCTKRMAWINIPSSGELPVAVPSFLCPPFSLAANRFFLLSTDRPVMVFHAVAGRRVSRQLSTERQPSWAKIFSPAAISTAYHDASRPWVGASLVVLFPAPVICAWPVRLLPCILRDRMLAAGILFPVPRQRCCQPFYYGDAKNTSDQDSPTSTRRCRRVSGLQNAHLCGPEI